MEITFEIKYDNEWEEYQVQYLENGKVNLAKTYHTEDRQDVIVTMHQMEKKYAIDQHTRIDQTGDKLNIPKIERKSKNGNTI